MDEDRTSAGIEGGEATDDEVAAAVDTALSVVLGSRRLPVSWLLVVDVLNDDGSQFPVVYERPESGWVEVLGLLESGNLIVRGSFVDVVREASEDDDE